MASDGWLLYVEGRLGSAWEAGEGIIYLHLYIRSRAS